MDISVKTKLLVEEFSTKYSYTWNFGADSLEKLLTVHEHCKRSLISSEIRFDSGTLAGIPHRMKIVLCKNGEVCVYICINKVSLANVARIENSTHRKITDFKVVCEVNSSEDSYVLVQYKDDKARNRIERMVVLGILQKKDFTRHKNETEYIFVGSHTSDYINSHKHRITELIFKLEVSHIHWDGGHLLKEECKVVSGSAHPSKRQRIDPKINNSLPTEAFFLSTKFSDFTIQCEGKDFPVHKIIIDTKSDVLARMLQEPYQEQKEGRLVLMEDPEIVEEFLRYLYTGKVNKLDENAYDLFLMADKNNVNDLKLLSESALISAITNDNFVKIYNLGKLVNSKTSNDACYEYFERNSNNLFKTADAFNEFSQECPDLVFLHFMKK